VKQPNEMPLGEDSALPLGANRLESELTH